jgi:hypothetical protein
MIRGSVFPLLPLVMASVACGGDGGSSSSSSSDASASNDAASSSTGAGAGGAGGSTTAATGCPACNEPVDAFVPASAGVVEASGLVASATHDGVLYAHNDSGDVARFFAIGPRGEDRGTYVLPRASAVDWEAMARGPCADATKSCLYFGDVGDNQEVRRTYTVHRVEEPATLSAGEHDVMFETFSFTYPDGSHNAEALLVHPTTGVVTVVTKSGRNTAAYEMPLPLRAGATVTLVGPQPVVVSGLVALVTGGDVHPAGSSVLLRTYTGVWLYPIASGQTAAQALGQQPCELPTPGEQQGETITWARDGKAYLTLSEGAGQTVHRVVCP